MNTTRVSKRAGRRLGILITLFMLAASMQAAEIIVTVTGTLSGGGDGARIFNTAKGLLDVLPFELVFRFDDSKGTPLLPHQSCPGSGSGRTGDRTESPGTAVLTVNGVSHEFGKMADAHSMAWRSTASRCSESGIRFVVDEHHLPYFNDVVNVMAEPPAGMRSLTQDINWRASISTAVKEWSQSSGFNIVRDVTHQSGSRFMVKSLTIKEASRENR